MNPISIPGTILGSWAEARAELPYLLRLSLGWLAILLVCFLVIGLAIGQLAPAGLPAIEEGGLPVAPGAVAALGFAGMAAWIASALMGAALAVAAHRAYLLREHRDGRMAPLDGRVWRFIGRSIVLGLIGLVEAAVVIGLAASVATTGTTLAMIIGAVLVVASWLLLARLSPFLPAAAVDDTGFGMSDAWASTAGQGWRILVAFIAAVLPLVILQQILDWIAAALAEGWPVLGAILLGLVAWVAGLAYGAVVAAVLSSVYRAVRGVAAITPAPSPR